MTADVLDLRGVTVVRGRKEILSEVDWGVEEGDRWVVLGPNGAGKTTLLQVASTYLFPTRGTVHVLGEQLGRVDVFEVRPRVGLASAALADRLPADEKVSDVVVTGAWAITGRWRERYEGTDDFRAAALLDQLGVAPLADRLFGTLSEGERKRVQIARALMADPELLLLDEPAAGLDLSAREDLVRRLTALAESEYAPALVLVTHHVEEVPPGFTHAMLLRDGAVVGAGPLEQVLTGPLLSEAFGLSIALERVGDRFFARAAPGYS